MQRRFEVSTGGLYVHDAGIRGLINYEKDQRKLREEALEYADETMRHPQVKTAPTQPQPVPVPVPVPVPWWWPE